MLQIDSNSPEIKSGGGSMPIPIAIPGIVQGGSTIITTIAKLFSRAPRGEYQKFLREAFPMMLRQAQARNTPVAALWFRGEIVEVRPDGGYGVVASGISSVQMYEKWLQDYGAKSNIYGLFCRDTLIDCEFRFYGPSPPILRPNGNGVVSTAGMFSIGSIVLLAVAGGIIWLLFGGK